jgi:hypothetical protein
MVILAHELQVALLSTENSPRPQGLHASLDFMPSTADAYPAGHDKQPAKDWPVAALNVPAGQSRQDELEFEPAVLENVPSSQNVHDVRPPLSPYDPGGHSRQLCMLGAARVGLWVPAGHSAHAAVASLSPCPVP